MKHAKPKYDIIGIKFIIDFKFSSMVGGGKFYCPFFVGNKAYTWSDSDNVIKTN